MKRLGAGCAMVLLILSNLGGLSAADSKLKSVGGIWSRDAYSVWTKECRQGYSIWSPDKSKRILIQCDGKREYSRIEVQAFNKKFDTEIGLMVNSEVAWAPDSKSFFVTYSEGGNVGTYQIQVYRFHDGKMDVILPAKRVLADAIRNYPMCFDKGTPNLGAIAWTKNSEQLLVAAEVLPHSNCDNMGTFTAYEIRVPSGEILRKVDQIETKRLFKEHLGTELRNAVDSCFSNPKECLIPQLHPKEFGLVENNGKKSK